MKTLRFLSYIFIPIILLLAILMFIKISQIGGISEREINNKEQEVKNTAIQDCFKAATVKTTENNTERIEPIFYIYELCLRDKGYTTTYSEK